MTCEAWPVEWPCDTTGVDPALQAQALDAAVALLWALSGRRLGVCDYTESYWPPCGEYGCPMPYISDGQWYNGVDAAECCKLMLHHRPVIEVTEVIEHGVTLAAGTDYRWDRSFLRRCHGCWPCRLDCCDPPLQVAYSAGVPLPAGTAGAVGEVGCEYLKAFTDQPCKLPSRVTSISRQGITMELGAPPTDNRLGLPLADAWLRLVNPSNLAVRSRVYSPDLPDVAVLHP